MKNLFLTLIPVVAGSLLVLNSASAQSLLLTDTNSSIVGYSSVKLNNPPASQPVYASFTLGSEGYSLTSISALLLPIASGQNYFATLSSGTIGNVVDTLNPVAGGSIVYGTPSVFTDSLSLSLLPNTTYWIGLSASVNTGLWAYTDTPNLSVTTDVFGSTINLGALNTTGSSSPFTQIYTVQAVPEPSIMVLAGLGGVCLLAIRRKQW